MNPSTDFESFAPVYFLLIFLGVFVLVLLAGAVTTRKAARVMRELAQRLGLEVREQPAALGIIPRLPVVQGVHRGKRVRLYTFTTGSGKSRKHWAAVGVTPAGATTIRFTLEVQGVGSRIMEFFGVKEITWGDPPFDNAWFVRASPTELFRVALIPEIRQKLVQARHAGLTGGFKGEPAEIRYAERGHFTADRLKRFELATELCCDLADLAEVAR